MPSPEHALSGARVVLDCRWLAHRVGAARVIELLLAELREAPPPGAWTLWGPPERLQQLRFHGAAVAPARRDPRMWAGQRDLLAVPPADVTVYTHQIRPLRPGASVTVVHDTISLRYGAGRAARLAKRQLFRAATRLSTEVLTASEFSRACIVRDLGVPPDRISIMRFPVDTERIAAIAQARTSLPQEERLLYVGRFIPHKNLHRLCLAFAESAFARRGGRLVLVGGWDGEVDAMRAWLASIRITGIEARPACSEEELDRFLATSRALVLPSLEEGYGLPAFEAAASGLPVAASRTGALTSLPPERAVLFDPRDAAAIAAAIDDATSRPPTGFHPIAQPALREVVIASTARALEQA